MATGIQGVQGHKGVRGPQGATGWGAIGSETGPTGPTGPIGWFQNQNTIQAQGDLVLYESYVSTIYKVTTGSQGTIRLNVDSFVPTGGFYVFTNQSASQNVTFDGSSFGVTIDGQASIVLPKGKSVMLTKTAGDELVSSYPYSGIGSTGTVQGGI